MKEHSFIEQVRKLVINNESISFKATKVVFNPAYLPREIHGIATKENGQEYEVCYDLSGQRITPCTDERLVIIEHITE